MSAEEDKPQIKEDYQLEYSKSARSKCKHCRQTIEKDVVRVGELTISDKFDGEYRVWFHTQCFFSKKGKVAASKLKGLDSLRPTDIPKIKRFCADEDDSKKRKADDDGNGEEAKKSKGEGEDEEDNDTTPGNDAYTEAEVKELWIIKDLLRRDYDNLNVLKDMMTDNGKHDKGGKPDLIDKISDGILRGKIPPCPECNQNRITFHHGKYKCHGDASAWSKCTWKSNEALERTAWKKPSGWAAKYKAFKKQREEESKEEAVASDDLFEDLVLYVIGRLSMPKTKFNQLVQKYGGQVLGLKDKITSKVSYVITSDEGVKAEPDKAQKALKNHTPTVTEDWVHDSIKAGKFEDVGSYTVFVKGDDVQEEVKERENKAKRNESEEKEGKMKVIRKGRSVVDAYYKDGEHYHVLEEGKECFTVMLNMADVTAGIRGRNTFWACQVLEHDTKKNNYMVYRRWGRVGDPGNNTVKEFSNASSAKQFFFTQYTDKTANDWDTRNNFEKVPGKMYPVDVDYGDDENADSSKLLDVSKATGSKLPQRVQNIISLMFDIEMMKSTLAELEIDVKKMPLGKLTKTQIKDGYTCLSEISRAIDNNDKKDVIGLTNKFYTLIPQDFGRSKPPIIDNKEIMDSKIQLLDTLRDIEIATSLLKMEDGESDNNALDVSYKKLKTTMVPLDKSGELYKQLENYALTSHDSNYFSNLKIQIEDIFEVDREGEESRFQPWEKKNNRMLLWHGSRLTNWVGILSQGLRIAPPEAPVSGYRFGKGVYFADVISKSGSYCFASPTHPVGLMILNEVALGDINKVKRDTYMEKAPAGTHSTQALGMTAPDPAADIIMDNGTVIPTGKLKKTGMSTSCSHNEFIVYDTAQIRTRFLLKVRFY